MIIYPKEYPSKIPKFYFQTKMFHPNIEETGYVSIDTSEWGPNVQISHIILSKVYEYFHRVASQLVSVSAVVSASHSLLCVCNSS